MRTRVTHPASRTRRGFTLWELVIVLTLLSIVTGLALPAFTSLGLSHDAQPADQVIRLLRDARRLAIARGGTVSLMLDPATRHYRLDSIGAAGGRGTVVDTTLDLPEGTTLSADSARARYLFFASGAAVADTLRVLTNGTSFAVTVDPWGGVARADTR